MKKQTAGVLIAADDGRTVYASGVAGDAALAAAVRAAWLARAERGRALFAVTHGAHHYAVVAVGTPAAAGPDGAAAPTSGKPRSPAADTAGNAAFVLFPGDAGDVLFDLAATVECADDILRHLLASPYEALTVVDRAGILRYISPVHENFFGLERGAATGKPVTEVIENTRLHEVVRTGKAEIGQLQEMRGTTRVVSRMPVLDGDGNVVAAIGQIMFKGPDQLQAMSNEIARLKSELSYYRQALSSQVSARHGLDRIIGQSPAIRRLKEQIARVAPLDVPVLLVGESGTGKELVAHALHLLSRRRDESMVMVNAAAIPATLVESELFGYEPGAFTGAERKGRRGKFEQADRGTLFFDEIGDMPIEIQVKLLRVLQDGSFERVGGDKPRVSDFRLISASNRDFQGMIDAGTFRLDLFYRISAVTLHLPPLRERLEDIELLANQALYDFAVKHSTRQKTLAPGVVPFLQSKSWPGNVRQLMHALETAAIFADSDVITVDDFLSLSGPAATDVQRLRERAAATLAEPAATSATASLPAGMAGAAGVDDDAADTPARTTLSQIEEQVIRDALLQFGGNKKRVARELGISRSYLYKRLATMNL